MVLRIVSTERRGCIWRSALWEMHQTVAESQKAKNQSQRNENERSRPKPNGWNETIFRSEMLPPVRVARGATDVNFIRGRWIFYGVDVIF
jgi:hypothetical protein